MSLMNDTGVRKSSMIDDINDTNAESVDLKDIVPNVEPHK